MRKLKTVRKYVLSKTAGAIRSFWQGKGMRLLKVILWIRKEICLDGIKEYTIIL